MKKRFYFLPLAFVALWYTSCKEETPAPTMSITTNAVDNVTGTSAICGGNITGTNDGYISARGVCWSISQNPTTSYSKTIDGSGTGSFTSSITELYANRIYYVRAYATNENGTSYSEQFTFTTATGLPAVTTNSVSNITATTATCGGNVTDDAGYAVTARGVCWHDYYTDPTTSQNKTVDGSGTGPFTSNITGLKANTTYYVRAYVTNQHGTTYGERMTFKTAAGK